MNVDDIWLHVFVVHCIYMYIYVCVNLIQSM